MNKQEMELAWRKIVEIHEYVRFEGSNRPDDCIRRCVEALGLDAVKEAISAAIILREYDGRVNIDNKRFAWSVHVEPWAHNVDYSNPLIYGSPNVDAIHPAHLNNMADSLRQYISLNRSNEIQKEDIHCSYQVIVNHGFDGGIDQKQEYKTLREAREVGNQYLQEGALGYAVFNIDTYTVEDIKKDFCFSIYDIFSKDVNISERVKKKMLPTGDEGVKQKSKKSHRQH